MATKTKPIDLTKLTPTELEAYKLKRYPYINRTELDRVFTEIHRRERDLYITEKDIADIIRRKRGIRADKKIIVTGVAIVCGQSNKGNNEHRLHLEYYF